MKVYVKTESTFTIEHLTSEEFGYIVACLGAQYAKDNWMYQLYDRLSDVAAENDVYHHAERFGVLKP